MQVSQKIIDYAIWYYLKYYPSVFKLKLKLKEKFGPESEKGVKYGGIDSDTIEYIVSEKLSNIIVEREVIASKINSYINKGKSKIYIRQKMFERLENKDIVEEVILELFEDGEKQNIKLQYDKIKEKYKREKIIEKLIRKGFFYNDILEVID